MLLFHMIRLNYALDSYSWKSTLLWGTCFDHLEKAKGSMGKSKIIHFAIAALEFIPIFGQIASIFEWAIVKLFQAKKIESPALNNRVNDLEATGNVSVYKWANIEDIFAYCKYQYDNIHLQKFNDFRYFVCSDDVITAKQQALNSEFSNFINESLSKNILFVVPLLLAEHWHLIVVNPHQKNIEHYDSLGKNISPSMQNCINEINNLIETYSKERYTLITETTVQQNNNYDCGVIISYYMEERLKGKSFSEIRTLSADYLTKAISQYRQTMYSRIGREFTGKEWSVPKSGLTPF